MANAPLPKPAARSPHSLSVADLLYVRCLAGTVKYFDYGKFNGNLRKFYIAQTFTEILRKFRGNFTEIGRKLDGN